MAPSCPFCGGPPRGTGGLPVVETMYMTGEVFTYDTCETCGSIWLRDPPTDLAPYYPTSYYSISNDPEALLGTFPARQVVARAGRSALTGRGLLAEALRRAGRRRREVQTLLSIYRSVRTAGLPLGAKTRVLDVGAGSGLLVYAMSLAGLEDILGVDPFGPEDRVFDTGAAIQRVPLEDLRGEWDLIMLHHTLEHVPSPASTLLTCGRMLSEDGSIVVRSPTVSSWAWRHYGSSWVQLDAPRHLAIPSRRGFAQVAKTAGLRVVSSADDSTAFQFWGSEQVQLGIALYGPRSVMTSPSKSSFSASQMRAWTKRAEELNRHRQGDQVAWVLSR